MDKSCEQCFYFDQCMSDDICKYYAPTDNEHSDSEIENVIECGRAEFRKEWFIYIYENTN